MSSLDQKLAELKNQQPQGYWGERILSQIEYANQLSKIKNHQYQTLLESTLSFLAERVIEEGTITKSAAMEAENSILEISPRAKEFKMICAAHAHIDMNWMWPWDETVAVTLDTFRTMLDLMKEYPAFKFSQSQASIYKIVEDYAPAMLAEIKERVKQGRWEVTASHWVEADKNMPNAESLSRHLLYTKRYLSNLLEIEPKTLNIDFEPDTFGHSVNVPEILSNGDVKYYYHCRGYEGHQLYRWYAPSGSSVTVYREPIWYNAEIDPSMALFLPEFCQTHNIDTMLKVYGVGDHGGGPTRRDIESIIDMNTWPVFPQIYFGTFGEFFTRVEKIKEQLPKVKGELNFIFTGCYTSQSRIKMANRVAEATLNEAETFYALSSLTDHTEYPKDSFEKAWRNVLFNQFHDIIPGSGIVDTREYAMGLFQSTMAIANTNRSLALRQITSHINTSELVTAHESFGDSVSEGAGVGFGIKEFKNMRTERGSGMTRIFHFFNSSLTARKEVVEVTVWDWKGNTKAIVFKDGAGNPTDHQLLDEGFNEYWGHHYIRVLVYVHVPACGYSTYVMSEQAYVTPLEYPEQPRVDQVDRFVLENDLIKATFHTQNATIVSLIDKSNGEELIDANYPAGVFRFIEEDDSKGMTAWWVGRYMNVRDLHQNVKIKPLFKHSNSLRQGILYEIEFESSSLKVEVTLDHDKARMDFNVECDWHELGKKGSRIPQLNFYVPVAYQCKFYRYDVPAGSIDRDARDMDVPGNSWMLGVNNHAGKKSVMIVTDSKYGFRGQDDSLSVTLIRSSFDPDPYPEQGIHRFRLAVGLVFSHSNKELIEYAYHYHHPLNVISDAAHKGTQPLSKSFVELLEGSVAISAIKIAEDDPSKLILRLYETNGAQTDAVLYFPNKAVESVDFVNLNEEKQELRFRPLVENNHVTVSIQPYQIVTLSIKLKEESIKGHAFK
ncbi:glycosyl hydrolase-related protein [Neobacillus pocheonensis]|uniref:Glycosyl hydrolase-related protein n=1 Tax=Neobacillus pocheonensis TaxID=363869 RepID=A0ABT0WFE4_9BACI|nr:glycosyl hydrolase-related protein [Neobacillus pocheonensis]